MLLEAVSTLSIRWFEPYRRCEALLQGRTFPAACWSPAEIPPWGLQGALNDF